MLTLTYTPLPDAGHVKRSLDGGRAAIVRTLSRSVDRPGIGRYEVLTGGKIVTAYADELTVALDATSLAHATGHPCVRVRA